MINEYLCFKAVLKSEKLIAWYCPAIPINAGPSYFSGLPGLIMELQVGEAKFDLKSIEISKENTDIELPNKGKIINYTEYSQIMNERMQNF